jgi:N-acetylmuramoyl-L-alanine amidase
MSRRLVLALISLALVALTLLGVWLVRPDLLTPRPFVLSRHDALADSPSPTGDEQSRVQLLIDLAPPPDWQRLDAYQHSITRQEFVRLVEEVFTVSPAWKQVIEVGQDSVSILTGEGHTWYRLAFADPALAAAPVARYWQPASARETVAAEQPLAGVRIAIDPGHIGGAFAHIEERWFRIGQGLPVAEGDMTLSVAKLLKPRLEALGAAVTLVRATPEPVTKALPGTFIDLACQQLGGAETTDPRAQLLARRLFYRTSEIRARARLVNEVIRPDLVLCLHFNAEGWGPDPANPVLSPKNHFHTLVNGAYTDEEILMPDQRFEMMLKILQGTHAEEVALAEPVVESFFAATKLPAYRYEPTSSRARNIADNPYIWARNLLANRTYECPVVYLEPYVMNSAEVHARVQAGDYEGLRDINGRSLPSLYREYADALTAGLRQRYLDARKIE